ncbi:MAG TPA: hypothetical protein VF510_15565 [Ktedonobacterales bacterium]
MTGAFAGLAEWVMVIALDASGGDINPGEVVRDVDEFVAGIVAGDVAGIVAGDVAGE